MYRDEAKELIDGMPIGENKTSLLQSFNSKEYTANLTVLKEGIAEYYYLLLVYSYGKVLAFSNDLQQLLEYVMEERNAHTIMYDSDLINRCVYLITTFNENRRKANNL